MKGGDVMKEKTRRSWMLNTETYAKIEAIAIKEKRTVSSQVELILEEFLKQYEERNPPK
jgi:hypothetical protein